MLVAIAIPVFTSQLEKSRESTDAANARSAYAEMMASAITDEGLNTTGNGSYTIATTGTAGARTYTATIPCKQMQTFSCVSEGVQLNEEVEKFVRDSSIEFYKRKMSVTYLVNDEEDRLARTML